MLKDKDEFKPIQQNSQLIEDIQYLLSSIRARQNGFVHFLERYKSFSLLDNLNEFEIHRNEFQQKQKIYTKQISSVIAKHFQTATGNLHPIRTFWIKLKSIIKVSIDRIKIISISHQNILKNYQKALISVCRCSQMEKGMVSYKEVENNLKKKTIQAITLGRTITPNSISYSESKIAKNRSQTLFKADIVSGFTLQQNKSNIFNNGGQTEILSKDRYGKFNRFNDGLQNIQEQKQNILHPKMKSLNRQKIRKDNYVKANMLNFLKFQHLHKQKSSKESQKHIKKITRHVEKYNKTLEGAIEGKHEVLLDKKKTIYQNIYAIYDNLFQRNIPNHKMISKFIFNNTKINQIIYSAYDKKKRIKKQKQKEKQKQKQREKQKNGKQTKQKQKQKQKIKQHLKQRQLNEGKSIKNHRKLHFQKLQTLQLPHKTTTSNATTIAQQKKSLRPKTVKIKVNSFNRHQITRIPGSAHGKRQNIIKALS